MFAFNKHLKKIREDKNITQKQLAKDINISLSSIQNYERGSKKPSYDALIALADYFNVSLDDLVGRNTPQN